MDASFAYLNFRKANFPRTNFRKTNLYKNSWAAKRTVKLALRQSGTILILVLLIVALVAGLSIKFAGEYQLGLARAESRWFGAQMRAYFISVESVVGEILKQDPPGRDDRTEAWAPEEGQEFPVEGGSIHIRIMDASAQLDLNALLKNKLDPSKSLTDPLRYDQTQRMFIRLLQEFPEQVRSLDEAATILQSVVYWAEPVLPNSIADDDQYYASQPVPYRASHTGSYRSLKELQLVRGITPELMNELSPFLVVLGGDIKMNINTLPKELIATLNVKADLRPMDPVAAESLYQQLLSQPVKELSELDTLMQSQFGQTTDVDRDFDNKTNFFWLNMTLMMGDQIRVQKSLMRRGANGAAFTVIRRDESF